MSENSLVISFANPSSTATQHEDVLIEQKPWGKDIGKTSNMQAIYGIAAAVGTGKWPEMYCGGLNGIFDATVYVYCSPGLSHQFKVSHGFVKKSILEQVVREEIIQCSFSLEQTTDYPVASMVSKAWVGHCYDNQGNIVSRPEVTENGSTITFSKEVFGSLRVRYYVLRHAYTVMVSKRFNSIENNYESVAYVVWNGGVKWIDIDAPANFEAFDGDCGNGAWYDADGNLIDLSPRGSMCVNDKTRIPVAVTADLKITMDYCEQEPIEEVLSETVDWETITEDCRKK